MEVFGQGLITVEDGFLKVNSGLSVREAAQANLRQHLAEQGFIAKADGNGGWSFSPYSWTDTAEDIPQGRKQPVVFVKGEAFDGKPFSELLFAAASDEASETDIRNCVNAINSLSEIAEAAYEKNIPLSDNGPLGTLMNENGEFLFLPASVFDRAVQSCSEREQALYSGFWKNEALSGLDAWHYTLSCYVYYLCCGGYPYSRENSSERLTDYYDRTYVKPEWRCILYNENQALSCDALFAAVNKNLSYCLEEPAGKKRSKKQSYKIETEKLPVLEIFTRREKKSYVNNAEYLQMMKDLKKKRFFRQYGFALKVGAAAVIAFLLIVVSMVKGRLDGPSVKGLSADQVVELFYHGINHLNPKEMDASRQKNAAGFYADTLISTYINSRVRENYERRHVYTPAQWLSVKNPPETGVYGISQLHIEEDSSVSASEYERHYTAHYYKIELKTAADEETYKEYDYLEVNEVTDKVTLAYNGKVWLVSDLKYQQTPVTVDTEAFFADLRAAMPEKHSFSQASDIINALDVKYHWLPTVDEAALGLEELLTPAN